MRLQCTRRYEEGDWKVRVIENLILEKDKEVRGANVRVITRGKPVYIRRPVQKLFPLEVNAGSLEGEIPPGAAALDDAWKTRDTLLDTEHG